MVAVVHDDGDLGRVRHGQRHAEARQQVGPGPAHHPPPPAGPPPPRRQVRARHGQRVEQRGVQVGRLDVDVAAGRVHGACHVRVVVPVALEHHVEVAGEVPVLDAELEGGVRLLHRREEVRGEDLRVEERGEAHPVLLPQPPARPELRLPALQPDHSIMIPRAAV